MTALDERRLEWIQRDDVLQAAAVLDRYLAGDRDQPWVRETLSEMGCAPESMLELPPDIPVDLRHCCQVLIIDDFIERMTRPKGTRGLCYN